MTVAIYMVLDIALLALIAYDWRIGLPVLLVVGYAWFVLAWYYLHTWPLWAWNDEPHPFARFIWRRLTRAS